MEGLCPLPKVDPHVGVQRGAKFHQENGEPTLAPENRWQHDLRPGLKSKDAEVHGFQVGFSTAFLSLDGNCGSDYNR